MTQAKGPNTELPPFAFENKDGEVLTTPPTPKRIKIVEWSIYG